MGGTITPAVLIEDLEFRWEKAPAPLLLKIPLLEVKLGERIFLHGPSGSGKSTLLNLLAGILSPSAGHIYILGQNLTALSPSQRDQFRGDHMGFVFQMFNLLPFYDAIENAVLPSHFSESKKSYIQSKGLTPEQEASRLLNELELPVSKLSQVPIHKLSVGQQQRVAAARALLGNPELIIADEPTSSLDSNVRDHFLKLLVSEVSKTNSSLLFVSHDLSLGKHFDRVISLIDINQVPPHHEGLL